MHQKKKQLAGLIVLTALFLTMLQPKAYAYLDPGSTGFFIQMLVAAAVGFSFAVKAFWGKIRDFLTKIFSGRKGPQAKS